ncbi:hypothetical protein J6O48_01595 [bacterium]|nr:hypothetical protein [bacterium]
MKIFKIFKILKKLYKSKNYIISFQEKDNTITEISDNIDNEWLGSVSQNLRNIIIDNIGEEEYGKHLDKYDIDLYNSYREIDYQISKSDYLEAAYDYYKLINDPNSGNANQAYIKYQNLKRLETIYKSLENEK